MGAKERGLFDMLRLQEIDRWQIIAVSRKQSVAEHSFNVWLLTRDLWGQLFPIEHNSLERDSAFLWALTHDMDEVYTGDIPTTVKKVLNVLSPGVTVKLKTEVMKEKMSEMLGHMRGIENTLAYTIVKIADIVESAIYIRDYAASGPRGAVLANRLVDRALNHIAIMNNKFPAVEWKKAVDWVQEVGGGEKID